MKTFVKTAIACAGFFTAAYLLRDITITFVGAPVGLATLIFGIGFLCGAVAK